LSLSPFIKQLQIFEQPVYKTIYSMDLDFALDILAPTPPDTLPAFIFPSG